jgi:restriction endonuclease Mrr
MRASVVLVDARTVRSVERRSLASSALTRTRQRLGWARTHLKAIGAAENSARGVWAITDMGQAIGQEEMHAATKAWRAEIRAKRLDMRVPDENDEQEEANRDGAPPVELIDGERLCDLLKDYGLGVAVKQRIEEDVVVQPDFFSEYE